MPNARGATLGLAIALGLSKPVVAETIRLPLSGPSKAAPHAPPVVKQAPPREEVPPWLDWALKVANGSLFKVPRPTWEGPLGLPGGLWGLELDAGYKARPDLGVGPTVAVLGRLKWLPWWVEGQVSALGRADGLGTSSEVVLNAAPVQLRLRTWTTPGASPPGQSVTLKLFQRF